MEAEALLVSYSHTGTKVLTEISFWLQSPSEHHAENHRKELERAQQEQDASHQKIQELQAQISNHYASGKGLDLQELQAHITSQYAAGKGMDVQSQLAFLPLLEQLHRLPPLRTGLVAPWVSATAQLAHISATAGGKASPSRYESSSMHALVFPGFCKA